MQLQYQVAAQAIEQDGKKYALIEIIDESECRNKWRINPAGKARALAGLLETPLLGPPQLGHGAIDVVGHPVDFESNHATKVLYEIKNPADFERIKSGEWKYVSPELRFLTDHYEDDTHVIDEWRFDHVAFVERGAFPNAGVLSTCTNPAQCGFSQAVTAALQSHGEGRDKMWVPTRREAGKDAREKNGGHPQRGVIVKKSEHKEVDAFMKCEHEKVIAELNQKNKDLETEKDETIATMQTEHKTALDEVTGKHKALETELADLKGKNTAATPATTTAASVDANAVATLQAELKVIKAENESLKAWQTAQEEIAHMKRVQAVVDLRLKAGLLETKNVKAAIETLKKLPNEALDEMEADLKAVQGKFDSLASGPKAHLIPSTVSARFNPLEATVGDLVGKPIGGKQ